MIKSLIKIMWVFIGLCMIVIAISLIRHFSIYALYGALPIIGFSIFGGLVITLLNKNEK